MRDLAVHTRKSPMQRANELCKFIKYLNGTAPEMEQLGMNREETVNYMGKWGLKIGTDQDRNNPELFDMKGRLLDPEPLIMRNPAQYDENGKGQPYEITGSREGDWDKTAKGMNLIPHPWPRL